MSKDAMDTHAIQSQLNAVPTWQHIGDRIEKTFSFKDFREAFAFMQAVATLAEDQQHHADWRNCYNRVSIALTTHDAGGLSEKDFTLAKSIDGLLQETT